MRSLSDIHEEYEFLEPDERYRLLIELGCELDEMPEALKTDATLVRGCSAKVWVYPTRQGDKLHFLADSTAAITKGIVALVLRAVQDRPAAEVATMDVAAQLQPHPGRAEHFRAGEGNRRADRGRLITSCVSCRRPRPAPRADRGCAAANRPP